MSAILENSVLTNGALELSSLASAILAITLFASENKGLGLRLHISEWKLHLALLLCELLSSTDRSLVAAYAIANSPIKEIHANYKRGNCPPNFLKIIIYLLINLELGPKALRFFNKTQPQPRCTYFNFKKKKRVRDGSNSVFVCSYHNYQSRQKHMGPFSVCHGRPEARKKEHDPNTTRPIQFLNFEPVPTQRAMLGFTARLKGRRSTAR